MSPPHPEFTVMATSRMPDEFFDALVHHLPTEQPVGPTGGDLCVVEGVKEEAS